MQGYLKLKEVNEELYETNFHFQNLENKHKFLINIMNFLIHIYFEIVVKIKKYFHIITIKEIYSGLIFILPFSLNEKHYNRNLKKCIPKVKKFMIKYQISTLILSEELQKSEYFLQKFQKNSKLEKQIHILNESEMMPYLIKEIIEYILQKQGKTTIELEDLYLLIEQDCMEYKENIAFLAQYFKTINIVTPQLDSYQKLANKLNENAIVTVNNNKKKSLRKAKWIVNFDMPIEKMKKYTIYRTASIIYLKKDEVYQLNGFDGLNICNAGIDVSEEIKEFFTEQHLIEQCSITVLYESTLINSRTFLSKKEQMKKDKVKIKKLYGSRGILEEKEYRKVE